MAVGRRKSGAVSWVAAGVCWLCAAIALAQEPAPEPGSQASVAEQPPAAGHRVALVIGNGNFRNYPVLRNPVNDAQDVAEHLRTLGFEVIERHDLAVHEIGPTLREFRERLDNADIGLVFIAGHGLQINGENYFPAADADIAGEDDVPMQSLAMNQLLDVLAAAKTRLNLLFLDACRNNPFALGTRAANRGLAAINAPSGTVISYATRPGSVANDGEGRNGLYTAELLRQMTDAPDVPIELVFKRIVSGVKQASKGHQEPWWEGSMEGNFCFRACRDEMLAGAGSAAGLAPAASAPPAKPAASAPRRALSKPAAPKPVTTPVQVALNDLQPLWFNRAMTRTETGSVYRLEKGKAWLQHTRTLAGNGGISSMAESPTGELYLCDATEGRILKVSGAGEVVAYQHNGPVKHLAFGPAGRLFFSSVSGSMSGGTIFELKDAKALPYYSVSAQSLPQGWGGTFAFDRGGMLWLSSGPGRPGRLYRVHGQDLETVYTSASGSVLGFSFLADGSIAYSDGARAVYRLTLPALRDAKLFDSPFEGALTDVKPARALSK